MSSNPKPLIEPRAQKINYLKEPIFDFKAIKDKTLEQINNVKALIPTSEKDLFKEIEFLSSLDLSAHAKNEIEGRVKRFLDHDIKDRGSKLLDFSGIKADASSEQEKQALRDYYHDLKERVIRSLKIVNKSSSFINERTGHQDQSYQELQEKMRNIAISILRNWRFWSENGQSHFEKYIKIEDSNINALLANGSELNRSEYSHLASFNIADFEKDLNNNDEKATLEFWKISSEDTQTVLEFLFLTAKELESHLEKVGSLTSNNSKLHFLEKANLSSTLGQRIQALHESFAKKMDSEFFNSIKSKFSERLTSILSRREALKNDLYHSNDDRKFLVNQGNINQSFEGLDQTAALEKLKKLEIAAWEVLSILKKISNLNSEAKSLEDEISAELQNSYNHLISQFREQAHFNKLENVSFWDRVYSKTRFDDQINQIVSLSGQVYHRFAANFQNTDSRLRLVRKNIDSEDNLSHAFDNILKEHHKELLPYYITTSKTFRVLQVLDSTFHRYRFGAENANSLHGVFPHTTENFTFDLDHDLKLEIEELQHLASLHSEKFSTHNLIESLVLFQLDNHVSDDHHLEKISLDHAILKNFLGHKASDKTRRVPPEPKKEEPPVQVIPEEVKPEVPVQHEEKPVEHHPEPETKHEEPQKVHHEEVKAEEKVEEKVVEPTPEVKAEEKNEEKQEEKVVAETQQPQVESQPQAQEESKAENQAEAKTEEKPTEAKPEEKQESENQSTVTEPSTQASDAQEDQAEEGETKAKEGGGKKKKKKKK